MEYTYQDFLNTEIVSKEYHTIAHFEEINGTLYIVTDVVKIPFIINYTSDACKALLVAAKQLLNTCLSLRESGVLMEGTIYD